MLVCAAAIAQDPSNMTDEDATRRRSAQRGRPMMYSRKALVTLGIGACVFKAEAASAAPEFSLQLGTDVPTAHPMAIRASEAAEKTNRDTGGRVEIKVFPNNTLGNDTSM